MTRPELQAARAVFRSAAFVVDLGLEVLDVGEGWCESRLVLAPRHLQHTGVAHAGVVTTLGDHSCGASAYTLAPAGVAVVTADLQVRLMRGAKGPVLFCRAEVIKPGRTLCFAEARIYSESGGQRSEVARISTTLALVATS
jgi:uncharacterized protein (TIGR00369 family)